MDSQGDQNYPGRQTHQHLRVFLLHYCMPTARLHGPDYARPWIPSFTICRQMSNQAVNLSWQHKSVAS